MLKKCIHCYVVKEENSSFFYFRKDTQKFSNICLICKKQKRSEYYVSHKKEVLDKDKIYREKNKENISERCKRYYINNREKFINYYKLNKDNIIDQHRIYNEKNKEKVALIKKNWYEENKEKILNKKHVNEYINYAKIFFEKAPIIHDNFYSYDNFIYINSITKSEIGCPVHGTFLQSPSDHLNERGCPLCSTTKGEKKIIKFLKYLNVDFIYNKKISNFRFDFLLPKQNIYIEYDGIQHFKPIEFFGGINGYMDTIKRDIKKNQYCRKNNMNLIRISYWQYSQIKNILKYLIEYN